MTDATILVTDKATEVIDASPVGSINTDVTALTMKAEPGRSPVSAVLWFCIIMLGVALIFISIELYRLRLQTKCLIESHSMQVVEEIVKGLPKDIHEVVDNKLKKHGVATKDLIRTELKNARYAADAHDLGETSEEENGLIFQNSPTQHGSPSPIVKLPESGVSVQRQMASIPMYEHPSSVIIEEVDCENQNSSVTFENESRNSENSYGSTISELGSKAFPSIAQGGSGHP